MTHGPTTAGLAIPPSALHSRERVAGEGDAPERLCLVAFSGDLDRLLAALTIATGAAASGVDVRLFFTFWATTALQRSRVRRWGTPLAWLRSWFLPAGTRRLALSRMHMGGIGTAMMRWNMRRKGVADVDELLGFAADLGVRIYVCEMSMDLLGICPDDLIAYPGIELCGIATFVDLTMGGRSTLFV